MEAGIMEEAIRLTLEWADSAGVAFEDLTPADFKYHGFDKIKDYTGGGLTGPINYPPGDRRGSPYIFIDQIREGVDHLIAKDILVPSLAKYAK
jgi:hypothetical protein